LTGRTSNSLDSVADRDFALETLAAATISATHLSRLSEEIVIWMTPQFGFVKLSDKWTTGSSIMPQKRNPDAAELCRAKVGRIAAAFQGLTMVMKGLPLTYSKDMQEDKEQTFDALQNYSVAVAAMAGMIADLQPVPERMAAAAGRWLFDSDRPCRLAGAHAENAVPRCPPRHRLDCETGRRARH
jgi:argininosuccinate lyase